MVWSGNSTKIRAVYVATDHDGLDVRELNERFPDRSYEFRMIKRLWAPATATNLWQTMTTATVGGLTFENTKTQIVVEALSDINILSHCDTFLGLMKEGQMIKCESFARKKDEKPTPPPWHTRVLTR